MNPNGFIHFLVGKMVESNILNRKSKLYLLIQNKVDAQRLQHEEAPIALIKTRNSLVKIIIYNPGTFMLYH